jgi:hypothetical protein
VLIVGRPERGAVYAAATRAEQRLRLPVNPTVYSPERWAEGDAFVSQLKSGHLTWILGGDVSDKVD